MTDTKKLNRLTKPMRQVLIHEMFSCCRYIDDCVINQYFPFVDSNDRNLKLTGAALQMKNRDFKDLRDAGVIAYKYDNQNKWYESSPADYILKIPADASETDRKHLEKLNFICRYIDEISGMEEELRSAETDADIGLDEAVYDYKYIVSEEFRKSIKPRTDYDIYRYNDPYVAEYVKLKGNTSIAEIKADFKLLETLGYLEYRYEDYRFCATEEFWYILSEHRQSFGIVRGKDGKFYI